ncbi:hypothetical protein BWI93_19070, partial [Siphonobacter sp. BAB-5385]|uniref:hypothetical protein n=1 Tax=Siphonobacter sp. BAB-5385 TaxID=1864822 RepID=UPI000BD1B6DC
MLPGYSYIRRSLRANTLYTLQANMQFEDAVKIRFERADRTLIKGVNANGVDFTELPYSFVTPPETVFIVFNTKTGGSSDYSKL